MSPLAPIHMCGGSGKPLTIRKQEEEVCNASSPFGSIALTSIPLGSIVVVFDSIGLDSVVFDSIGSTPFGSGFVPWTYYLSNAF